MRDVFFYLLGLSTLPTLFMLLCVWLVVKAAVIHMRQERLKRQAALYPLAKRSDSDICRARAIQ